MLSRGQNVQYALHRFVGSISTVIVILDPWSRSTHHIAISEGCRPRRAAVCGVECVLSGSTTQAVDGVGVFGRGRHGVAKDAPHARAVSRDDLLRPGGAS